MSGLAIDPSKVWIRHLVRLPEGRSTSEGFQIAGAWFIDAAKLGKDGLNGENGWASATATPTLSDDGPFSLSFPNDVGDDGILHVDRFEIVSTEEEYEAGEELIEVWTDQDAIKPLYVGTPTDYQLSPSTVGISGTDLMVILDGAMSSEVDYWESRAPADALKHYTRLPILCYGQDLAVKISKGHPWKQALEEVQGDCWTAEVTVVVPPLPTAGGCALELIVGGGFDRLHYTVEANGGEAENLVVFGGEVEVDGRYHGTPGAGTYSLRIVRRYDRLFAFINGELVADVRRTAAEVAASIAAPPKSITLECELSEAPGVEPEVIRGQVETLAPFAGKEAGLFDLQVPGEPPSGGLHVEYWGYDALFSQFGAGSLRRSRLWSALSNVTPAVDRVDPVVDIAAGAPAPLPGSHAARWSGAIHLDLAIADRNLKVIAEGGWRVYVGQTMVGQEYLDKWESTGLHNQEGGGLRAHLGTEESGWYPIVIEQYGSGGETAMVLEDGLAGVHSVTPSSRLSPLGVYENLVRYTAHSSVFRSICEMFGYQWRVEPRSLESGSSPGQLSARLMQGRQTNKTITEDDTAGDIQVVGSATDVVDGLIADAAGLADPRGSGQLSVEEVEFVRANKHMALRRLYESLADITEEPLLRSRLRSLLALKSSPNEQVGLSPVMERDFVDSLPLTGTLMKFNWEPGDGAKLSFQKVKVVDESPRQMTSIAWRLVPDGIAGATVAFRSRTRNSKSALRKIVGAVTAPRRTYQGGISTVTGGIGSSAGGGGVDIYSRAFLPSGVGRIDSIILVVSVLTGGGWEIVTSPTELKTGIIVNKAGHYDLTSVIRKDTFAGGFYIYAALKGGSGTFIAQLEVNAVKK